VLWTYQIQVGVHDWQKGNEIQGLQGQSGGSNRIHTQVDTIKQAQEEAKPKQQVHQLGKGFHRGLGIHFRALEQNGFYFFPRKRHIRFLFLVYS
jgi:hypothetical protein